MILRAQTHAVIIACRRCRSGRGHFSFEITLRPVTAKANTALASAVPAAARSYYLVVFTLSIARILSSREALPYSLV